MKILSAIPGLVLLVAGGCTPPSAPVEKPPSSDPVVQEPSPAKPKLAFQHDGYTYGGFDLDAPQSYVVKISGQQDSEGTETRTVKSTTDDGITIERTRTGALSAVGTDTVNIDAKGVSVTSVSIGQLSAPSLELPADLTIGKTWKAAYDIKTDTETIKNSGTYKVVGDEQVKVPAGSFQARKVVLTGTIETSKGHGKVSSTFFFVKGLGAVKSDTSIRFDGQEPQSFILELKK